MSKRPPKTTARAAGNPSGRTPPRRKLSGDVELEIELLRRSEAGGELAEPPPDSDTTSVLVVDDDPDMRRYVRRSLQRMQLPIGRIFEAGRSTEAQRILADEHIDLLITDLVLAGDDGLTLIRAVRAAPATAAVSVVLMTGKASYRETIERAREAGALALLIKPFNAGKLRDVVAPLIASKLGRAGS